MDQKLFTPTALFQTVSWDLDQINESSHGWDNQWTPMKRGDVRADMRMFNTLRMQFSWMSYNNAVLIEGSHPAGSVALSLVRSNALVSSHNQTIEPYELVIHTEGDTVDYLASGENHVFTLVIEEKLFYQSFFFYFGYTFEEVIENKRVLLKEDYADLFILQMQHWLKYFQEEKNRKRSLEQFYGIEQEILEQLFSVIRMTEPKACSKEKFDLGKVREVLHENVDNIFNIHDVVTELGISPRTMQYHFKKKFGMTPKQYLHHLRLNAIRKELIKSDPDTAKISEIALKYGFFHSSHFGSEYKKIFGETPSQTLGHLS